MENDRIAEIGERTLVHCHEAQEQLAKYRAAAEACGRPEDYADHAARIVARLQSEMAREAAILGAEEIVSAATSVVRGDAAPPSDAGAS